MLDKSLFWKLYSPEQEDRFSTIFGTIHLSINNDSLLSRISDCIDMYDSVYTETDLSGQGISYMQKFITVNPEVWNEYLSHKQFEKMRGIFLKTYDVDIAAYTFLRPLFVQSIFYQHSMFSSDGHKLDEFIFQTAISKNKKTGGIESIQDQVRILNSIPIEFGFMQLKKWARNVSKMNKQLTSLIDYYNKEDILTLYKRSNRSLGPIKQTLLTDRNEYMANRIIQIHEESPSLLTFGAGHLAGKKGVLHLLKSKGYKVKALRNKEI